MTRDRLAEWLGSPACNCGLTDGQRKVLADALMPLVERLERIRSRAKQIHAEAVPLERSNAIRAGKIEELSLAIQSNVNAALERITGKGTE